MPTFLTVRSRSSIIIFDQFSLQSTVLIFSTHEPPFVPPFVVRAPFCCAQPAPAVMREG